MPSFFGCFCWFLWCLSLLVVPISKTREEDLPGPGSWEDGSGGLGLLRS